MTDVNDIMENIPYLERNEWERTRFSSFLFAKANFKGINKTTDMEKFLKFPWDKEEAKVEKARKKQSKTTTTDKDIEKMKHLAAQWQ